MNGCSRALEDVQDDDDRDFGHNENGSFIFATVAETGEVLTR